MAGPDRAGDPLAHHFGDRARLREREPARRQVAEIKSRLQRISPVEHADAYHQHFGDLVALEQYYRALREQALGAQA